MNCEKKMKIEKIDRYGFTLIELLVVILIIALLSGITVTVFRQAKVTVKSSLVAADLTQLSMALDQYKARFGEYPPDFSDPFAVMRHVRKRWPRYGLDVSEDGFTVFMNHIQWGSALSSNNAYSWQFLNPSAALNLNYSRYVSSLVFWLGGLPDANGIPQGFYMSPTAPLGYKKVAANFSEFILPSNNQREETMYSFNEKNCINLQIETTNFTLPFVISGGLPIVYFKATPNVTGKGAYAEPSDVTMIKSLDFSVSKFSACGMAVPYGKKEKVEGVSPMVWYEQDRFQLVHPGEDGVFGMLPGIDQIPLGDREAKYGIWCNQRRQNVVFPITLSNLTKEDEDNITNFLSSGNSLISEQDK